MTRKKLHEIISFEGKIYSEYMFPSKKKAFLAFLKNEPAMLIWKWQRLSRIVDFYHKRIKKRKASLLDKLKYLLYKSLFQRKSALLGLEVCTENIGKGLLIYHYGGGVVINGGAVIGENCRFHGNNCIGNAGPNNLACPVIGNNVLFGVGAKVIGNVRIADNVKIAAGAVVIEDVNAKGCTVAGVPAKIVKFGD